MSTSPAGQGRVTARLLAEALLIVISILLAFAIDRAWEQRSLAAEEQEILLGLQADFLEIEQDLIGFLETSATLTRDVEWLLETGGDPTAEIPVARADSAFRRLIQAPSFDPGHATLDALLGSGRLGVIQNRELREALSEWIAELDVREDQEVVQEFIREAVVPYLARERAPLIRIYGTGLGRPDRPDTNVPASRMTEDQASAAYARILVQEEFRGLAVYRHNWQVVVSGGLDGALAVARRILALLEDEIFG